METVHVINLEKYQPGYTDRHHRWAKVYYDILLDPDFQSLDEIDRYRYISLILYETFLMGKPLVLTSTNLALLGWDKKKKRIPLSLQMLHTFVESVTDDSKERNVEKSRVEYIKKSRVEKSKYLDFVFLTSEEYKKLFIRYGEIPTGKLIDSLNRYIGQSGKKYDSHYFALLNFAKRDDVRELPTSDGGAASEQKDLEKRKQQIRDLEDEYYRDQSIETLQAWLTDKEHIHRRWLIKEILASPAQHD